MKNLITNKQNGVARRTRGLHALHGLLVYSDAASRITSRTTGGVTTTYTYDWRDQLLSETRPGYAASYTYDHNGNRLSRTINGVTEDYLYSDEDQLLEVVGGTDPRTFAYDKQGRTILIDRAGKVNDQEFTYDQESRITSVTRNGQTVTYAYNGLDTRTAVTMGNTVNTFLRDGAYVTDPVLVDSGATYTPGISERRGMTTTYLHSGLKNAFAQSGGAQTVAAVREYDAFGNVTSSSGAWAGPFGYAGKFGYQSPSIPGTSTPDEGLTLMGHRYYDPSTGRFLTRDPIFDGRNWYSYGGGEGNPLTQADPTGLLRGLIKKAVDALLDLLKGPKPKPSPAPTPAKPGKPQPTDYPPNNGAIPGSEKTTRLEVGTLLDRFGPIGPDSNFAAPFGSDPDKLALRPGTSKNPFTLIVEEAFDVEESTVAGWVDKYGNDWGPGGGIQYRLPDPILTLIEQGKLRRR